MRRETGRERDRAAGPDRLDPVADDVDLSQQFVCEGKGPILIGQLVPRFVAGRPARADDSVDASYAIKQGRERLWIGDVNALARIARGADALPFAERLDNLSPDEPGGPDDEYLAHYSPFAFPP